MEIKICGNRKVIEKDRQGNPTGLIMDFTRESEELSEFNEKTRLCYIKDNVRSQEFSIEVFIDKIIFLLFILIIIACEGENICVAIDSMFHQKSDYKLLGIDMNMSFKIKYKVPLDLIFEISKTDLRVKVFCQEIYIQISHEI